MPMYEFHCEVCKRDFEELVSVSGDQKPACPECGGADTRRLISATSSCQPLPSPSKMGIPSGGGAGGCGSGGFT